MSTASAGTPSPHAADAPAARVPAAEGRGAQRREQLLAAGAALLGETGWASITARAVASRAGTHAGLVHYHFGSLPALKRDVAALAVRRQFDAALGILTSSSDWSAGLAAVLRAAARAPDDASARVSAELITAALQDPEISELIRRVLADARAELVPWLRRTGAAEPEGMATLLVAALDGMLLHRLVDPGLPLERAARAARTLAQDSDRPQASRRNRASRADRQA